MQWSTDVTAPRFRRGTLAAEQSSARGSSSGLSLTEMQMLDDGEKEQLCRDLLAEFGAEVVSVKPDGEMLHSCCLPFGHRDSNPSASLNYKTLLYNCLAGETLVKTWDGPLPIADLAGGRHLLIDGNGQWVEAEVRDFGVQALRKITLRRNKVVKVVYATGNHRWFRQTKGSYADGRNGDLVELTTDDLRPGHRLPSVWSTSSSTLTVSPQGVARGFTYGDGTTITSGARAYFCGPKDQHLLPYFAPAEVKYDARGVGRIDGLPRTWKVDLPEMDEGVDYLYGWLAGYLAADGHVDKRGFPSIASAKRGPLEWVAMLCDRLGIKILGIYEQTRKGYGVEPTSLYHLRFARGALPEDFFIIPEHRRRVADAPSSFERTHWTVLSVEETDRVEPVYCAIVPTTHSFVLDDNLLTSNCYVCGGGSILWLIGMCRDITGEEARSWVIKRTGLEEGRTKEQLLALLENIFNQVQESPPPMPRMGDDVLKPWMLIHPYLTEVRHIPEQTILDFKVGYDPVKDRIIFPHWWRGQLVGWQSRRLSDDGTPKYLNTPDFPKDRTIYNYDDRRSQAVVVESVMSVLRHAHHCPIMEATFGAEIPDAQIRLLGQHDRVLLWMDNDKAGWNAVDRLVSELSKSTDVWVVPSPWAADPGDLDDTTFGTLLAGAVPYPLWKRPDQLQTWEVS